MFALYIYFLMESLPQPTKGICHHGLTGKVREVSQLGSSSHLHSVKPLICVCVVPHVGIATASVD